LIRVWVPGCSTGEEAYSLAMLLQEQMDAIKKYPKVQVFATDIDGKAIEVARNGTYPTSIAADLTPERLARFFSKVSDGNTYRIQKGLRDLLIFSEQNVIKDPPFSKLDLLSCRNLLIYLDVELQKKLIPLFHYALNPGGFLFLGSSETVSEFGNLFDALDRKAKLYRRKQDIGEVLSIGKFLPLPAQGMMVPQPVFNGQGELKIPLCELTERVLLEHFEAVGALVSERGDIHYLHGRTGRFLELAPGEPDMNILKMAREGLKPAMTTALHKAIAHLGPVFLKGLQVKTNGDMSTVNLTVRPATTSSMTTALPKLFLVILEELPSVCQNQPGASHGEGIESHPRILALQQELRTAQEYLQSSTEELETANEELKSTNKELQSVNEELQSTNEELETSKEELQSVNEELTTVNNELQTKVTDLARANNDLSNLLASTEIGTIFVDHHMHIQRFTPAITQVINLIPSDIGRPVGHIVSNLVGYASLVDDTKVVLNSLIPKEIEVQTLSGIWFMLRIRPYRTLENVIEGAVITFVDITALKQAETLVRESQSLRHLAVVVRDSSDAILMLNLLGRILAWNPAAARLYGWSEDDALVKNISELIPESLRWEALATMQSLSKGKVLAPYATQRIAKDGRIVNVWVSVSALLNETGEVYAIATTERERQ